LAQDFVIKLLRHLSYCSSPFVNMAVRNILVLLPLLASAFTLDSAVLQDEKLSPIQKVVKLVTEMKAQTVKEGEEDLAAYDKYKCWCETTTSEKSAAVTAATQKIQELTSFVEEAAAKEGELKTEIAGLEDDIVADKDSLASATSMRNEANAEFATEEADMKETIGLLTEALEVLNKVQLVQKGSKAERTALVQVRNIVQRASPHFKSVMQKDLYDMLGEFSDVDGQQAKLSSKIVTGSFLGEVFLPKTEAAALTQAAHGGPTGAAAGAKSHNSRSGGIVGLLSAQKDEFESKLAAATKEETTSLANFNKLAAAKNGEIQSATKQKDNKEVELADTMDKAAKAKEDIEATTNALDADQRFLLEATQSCQVEDDLYAKRSKVRNEEVNALSETLNILTGDEARSLFDKTMSFVQLASVRRSSSALAAAQDAAKNQAFARIMKVSKSHKNWMLASLAVRVKIDAFTKVVAACDKMLAELKSQQKVEYEKWETCKADLDTTEDKIWNANVVKRDLGSKHKDVTNSIEVLTADIADLTKEVAEAEVSLKVAGENRKEENALFQSSMTDQHATVAILNMALKRLEEFYKPKLVQVQAHANPPPKPSGPEATGYSKSSSSGGVLQLLSMIIADTGRTIDEMRSSENESQADYAANVAATTDSIQAGRAAIAEKEKQNATGKGEQSETEEAQLANGQSLDKLSELLSGIHGQCDFVIKYFDIRQKSRAEEMDAIEEAKAILSGADFA